MKKALVAAALICASPAQAAKFGLAFEPGQDQSLRMENGVGAIDSHQESSSIRLIPVDEAVKKRGLLRFMVMNHSPSPFNVGPENVSARLADGTAVPIIAYEQLRKEEKNRQMWRSIAAGLAAASNNLNASNAGWSSGSGTFRATSFGAGGTTRSYGTGSWTTYNAGQAAMAQSAANADNQRIFANLADAKAEGNAALGEYLRTSTVDPDAMFGGTIVYELPPAARSAKAPVEVTFLVTIAGQTHEVRSTLKPE